MIPKVSRQITPVILPAIATIVKQVAPNTRLKESKISIPPGADPQRLQPQLSASLVAYTPVRTGQDGFQSRTLWHEEGAPEGVSASSAPVINQSPTTENSETQSQLDYDLRRLLSRVSPQHFGG